MYPVPYDREFARIDALPRRTLKPDVTGLTERFLSPGGLAMWRALRGQREALLQLGLDGYPLELKPEQAAMVGEFETCRGVTVGVPVGGGKTLAVRLCAIVAEEWGLERVVLLLPANLVPDTHAAWRRFDEFWRAPKRDPLIVTYSALGLERNAYLLCDCPLCCKDPDRQNRGSLRPQALFGDESDLLRSTTSAVSRRVARFCSRHPETVSGWFTGSLMRHSIRDMARQLAWSLKLGAPIPLNYQAIELWSDALADNNHVQDRPPPGALTLWSGGRTDLPSVRAGVAERLCDTPGVVIFPESTCDQPLTIRLLPVQSDPKLDELFERFRETDETPDGWAMGDPLSWMRHGTELGAGFYYRWDPRPPQPWLVARTAVQRFVTERIRDSQHASVPLDSEGAVFRRFHQAPEVVAWRAIRDTFKPNSVPVPISMAVVVAVQEWLREHSPGVVWVQHRFVGETLAKVTGLLYYSRKGLTADGRSILKHDRKRSMICSVHANRRGRNLQYLNRGLTVGPEHSAERWEQRLGRLHRYGQERPVTEDILIGCAENLVAVAAAITEAEGVQATTTMRQKLLSATWQNLLGAIPDTPRWTPRGGVERLIKVHEKVVISNGGC